MRLRDRISPTLYELTTKGFERGWGGAMRRKLLAGARGRVLEIGAGTGANLAHYPPELDELVVTEPGAGMVRRVRERAAAAARAVTVVQASAEALPFEDASFDTVVSTLVLCSVGDQAQALGEIRRVLKPGGRLIFLEHVRSDDPGRARWQDRLERPWKAIGDGCCPNRATLAQIEASGFAVGEVERGDIPHTPPFLRPYVAGTAVRRAPA